MIKSFLIVWILSSVALMVIGEDKKWYPNLGCHPEFPKTRYGSEVGTGILEYILDSCKMYDRSYYRKDDCWQRCVFEDHRVLDGEQWEEYVLIDEAKMLGVHFASYDDELRVRLAKRIVSECSAEVNATAGVPCEQKTSLWSCFEKAIDC